MLLTQEEWERIDTSMFSLDERHAIGTAIQDLFVIGCLLCAEGRRDAGVKAIDTALKAISLDKKSKLLFLKIIDNLEGNEREFANRISAHYEIKELFQ